MIVERLDEKRHDRSAFDCGEETLNRFLRTAAGQDHRRDLSVTYVAVEHPGAATIQGYYTLLASIVRSEIVPSRKLPPSRDIPVALLGRLAVSLGCQGHGIGKTLLFDAMGRVEQVAAQLGLHALVVDALHERTAAFYAKYGFVPLADDPLHLYLPVQTIRMMGLAAPAG